MNSYKKFIVSTISLVLLNLAFFAPCYAEVSKIGVILPLTGPLAEYGVAMQNGIKLAEKNYPEKFKNIEFEYQDSMYKPQVAISSFRKLIADKSVKLIINFGCPTSQALVPIVEKEKIPTAMYCSSVLMTKDKEYSFGMTSPANEWAERLYEYLAKAKYQKPCLLLTENDYLISEYNALKNHYISNQGKDLISLIDRYNPDELDFRSSILKIKAKQCDALGVYLLPGQIRTFFNQSKGFNLNAQIFGTDIFESKEEIKAANQGMEGAVYVNLAMPEEFKENYQSEFNNDNQATSACITHDLVVRLAELINSGQESASLMSLIKNSKQQSYNCGKSEFISSETGEQFLRYPIALKQIKNDQIKELN